MSSLQALAREVGVSDRTLRRAAERGLIRTVSRSARRIEVSFAEGRYVEAHWAILSSLLRALRTRHNVRLAVVYGSTARGDDRPDSDVDLLVSFRHEEAHTAASLAGTLTEEIGREVHVTSLEAALRSPPLLLDIVREGRPLVDRDGEWPGLKDAELRIERQAAAAEDDLDRRVAKLAELVG
jgi:predicted nucleotidyltransferase